MAASKIAVSIPANLVKKAKHEVKSGRAKSVSALVTDALADKLKRDELGRILEEMDVKYGPPGKEAEQWAERVLNRAESLQRRR
jgi:Arc/MetJ-type ribon-helix-helix transcriptional regulator